MPKVKKKSDKQRQRQNRDHKREQRVAVAQSKGESHVSIGTGMSETDTTKNSSDKSGMSNSDELLSTNSSVVDSATGNVRSAQEIVDKYLQSQKDLARRFKKKHPDTKVDTNDSAQKSVNEMNDRSSGQSKCKDKRRQYNTEWKKRARTVRIQGTWNAS